MESQLRHLTEVGRNPVTKENILYSSFGKSSVPYGLHQTGGRWAMVFWSCAKCHRKMNVQALCSACACMYTLVRTLWIWVNHP